MSSFQNVTNPNRRHFPRIETSLPCFVQLRSFEFKSFDNTPRFPGILLNVSAEGVLFESEKELPIYPYSTWQFYVDFKGKELTFAGYFVRKSKNGSRYLFGAEVAPIEPHVSNLGYFWSELQAEISQK